jgi:flagellar biosynthesis/type III secretory pathway protein FliH
VTARLGRVIKSAELSDATTLRMPETGTRSFGRTVSARVIEAQAEAQRILDAAEAKVRALIADAERATAHVRLRAETEGRAAGVAAVAARAIALARREAESTEQSLDQTVDLARLLAERLLGEALRLEPERVAGLARQALREARGARQIKIVAHPNDAVTLGGALGELGVDSSVVSIEADPGREPGNLRMVTDIGVLDAELSPQLARLALKLREALQDER